LELGQPAVELLLEDCANGSKCQALNFGLEPRDFIGQRGAVIGTPHGLRIIVGSTGRSVPGDHNPSTQPPISGSTRVDKEKKRLAIIVLFQIMFEPAKVT
jgi:hypothetical protein